MPVIAASADRWPHLDAHERKLRAADHRRAPQIAVRQAVLREHDRDVPARARALPCVPGLPLHAFVEGQHDNAFLHPGSHGRVCVEVVLGRGESGARPLLVARHHRPRSEGIGLHPGHPRALILVALRRVREGACELRKLLVGRVGVVAVAEHHEHAVTHAVERELTHHDRRPERGRALGDHLQPERKLDLAVHRARDRQGRAVLAKPHVDAGHVRVRRRRKLQRGAYEGTADRILGVERLGAGRERDRTDLAVRVLRVVLAHFVLDLVRRVPGGIEVARARNGNERLLMAAPILRDLLFQQADVFELRRRADEHAATGDDAHHSRVVNLAVVDHGR